MPCFIKKNNMSILSIIKNWTLPIVILLGALNYHWVWHLAFLMPYLIFVILWLTFSKISFKDIKFSPWHIWILLIEIFGSLALYYALAGFNRVLAQGIMITVLSPTATAAAVVIGKLRANVASISTYTLLSSTVVAIIVPFVFPLINPDFADATFLSAFWHVLSKVFPMLIIPFILAQALRKWLPKVNDKIIKISNSAFYIWAASLIIATGKTVHDIIRFHINTDIELLIGFGALVTCLLQFWAGRLIGRKYNDSITAGQALGQKNTILAIWMAGTFLDPVSAIGPGAYMIWQNIVNSWELWEDRKNH